MSLVLVAALTSLMVSVPKLPEVAPLADARAPAVVVSEKVTIGPVDTCVTLATLAVAAPSPATPMVRKFCAPMVLTS